MPEMNTHIKVKVATKARLDGLKKAISANSLDAVLVWLLDKHKMPEKSIKEIRESIK